MLFRHTVPANVAVVLHRLAAFVVPPACVACRAPLTRSEVALCPTCVRALPWLPRGCCRRCALPSHQGRRCPAAAAGFGRAWAVMSHEGVARELVHSMKFRGALWLADVAAAQVVAVAVHLPDAATLVPVPAVPARRRLRGFDVAERLATGVGQRAGLPVACCLRRHDHVHQVGAGRRERRRGGRLSFAAVEVPPGAHAVLVDDVHTTGATLDACARALLAAGADRVDALTYARTL